MSLPTTLNDTEQNYIAIEKYLSLMMIDFNEHVGKYKNMYSNVKYLNLNYFIDVWEHKRLLRII
jgi:hypothetical protein